MPPLSSSPATPTLSTAFGLSINAYTVTTALGRGLQAHIDALRDRRSGLRRNDFGAFAEQAWLDTWIGRVDGLEASSLPNSMSQWECRNNRLAWIGLQQDGLLDAVSRTRERYGADRVAIVLGTSTASIGATEEAYARLVPDPKGAIRFPDDLMRSIVHTPHSLGAFVQHATGLRGPCSTVATACSSSAKVFAQAARLIAHDVVDAALVGGVDTLCGSVLYGFNALGLVSTRPCRPFDAQRDGLSLGEAAGFALLKRNGATPTKAQSHRALRLRGYGESSDAYHMSSPHPQGLGAQCSMRAALARAGVNANEVGYLNLHGTATPANDAIEANAVQAIFPETLHASSTKGWTGHTLGAAGVVEAVFALIALEQGLLPGMLNSSQRDPVCGPQIQFENAQRDIRYAMSNSFGFGGNNCSLLFENPCAR